MGDNCLIWLCDSFKSPASASLPDPASYGKDFCVTSTVSQQAPTHTTGRRQWLDLYKALDSTWPLKHNLTRNTRAFLFLPGESGSQPSHQSVLTKRGIRPQSSLWCLNMVRGPGLAWTLSQSLTASIKKNEEMCIVCLFLEIEAKIFNLQLCMWCVYYFSKDFHILILLWVNLPRGLEQFFHVCSRPACFSGNFYFTIKNFSISPAHLTAFLL